MSPLALFFKALIRAYQWFVSPILGAHCRHWPSCSAYAVEALEMHGALRGAWLGLVRVIKCNPWGTWGYDPVPENAARAGWSGWRAGVSIRDTARRPHDGEAKDGRAADPAIPARPEELVHGR